MAVQHGQTNLYIDDLPWLEREELCRILNQNNEWEELAGKWMKFDVSTVQCLRKNENPTDKLLKMWTTFNHTVQELFLLLYKMQHHQAMLLLKNFVNPKYSKLITNRKRPSAQLLNCHVADEHSKDLKIGTNNFNHIQPASSDVQKLCIYQTMYERVAKMLDKFPLPNDLDPSNSDNMLVPTGVNQNLAPVPRPVVDGSKNNNQLKISLIDTDLPQPSYEELAKATHNWSKHNILGRGGFGTVFKGIWKGTPVAIKKIEQRGSDSKESYLIQVEQSLRELKILYARRHDNILPLYGHSIGGEAPCLVYQLMPNGSLEDKLSLRQGSQPLNWLQRHNIATGTAGGLQYLHTIGHKPLIHGDIKSANILLDKNFEPKIGDFGLARDGPEQDYMKVSRVQGTRPYLPDEFLRDRNLSTKVDTYSYGIVLLELATGLGAYSNARPEHKFLKAYVDSFEEKDIRLLKDSTAGTEKDKVFDNLIVLGKWCANTLPKDRPQMVDVHRKLERL
ncbi:pelle-like serine/threonine-protein kinase pik-1 [Neodiprion lecontei]|uniref:non-specific serine/threonine protein kinase n=1 Tax=Neodiprion lecontei TaxID=441921 RepID=A0A6J0B9U7_NEOLC|nr:pelle-like serine/threonine-protein kinase pik-1 [Neodiprion lecontei]XP_015511734.1 pelle-like serine/threonine-protein kinase pik-1 [Neodiprion lecontei]